jgi:uncharacterized protein
MKPYLVRIVNIRRNPLVLVTAAFLNALFPAIPETVAAENPSFEEAYTKHEYRIPMRDGVKLFTLVYTPKESGTNFPILFQRTPYSLKPYTIDSVGKPGGAPESLVREKFIFALQDVRGRFGSGGQFVDMRPYLKAKTSTKDIDESTDAYDTIDWLVKHVRHNNGKVGMRGISYPGFYAAAGMINSHPALKAVSPQAPSVDVYGGDDTLHGGGFWLIHNFGWFYSFGQQLEDPVREEPRSFDFKTPDGYEFFLHAGAVGHLGATQFKGRVLIWDNMISHIQDARWCAERDLTPHLKNVRAAVMTVGGWFDAEDLHGALKTFQATERLNPGIFNCLVMGPWSHGGWHRGDGDVLGPIKFHSKTGEFFREEIETPFFRSLLKFGTNAALPKAYVFETGTDEWRKYASWPPANAVARTLWLQTEGKLSFSSSPDSSSSFDEYASDPNHPVPFTSRIASSMPKDYMVEDQRFAARRPDVLTYQTDPLLDDVTVAGPITASLYVSTTGTDSDWIVKLIDVFTPDAPDSASNQANITMGGYQQLVRGEPLRGKYRNGYDKPQPFKPGEVTKVEWTLPDVCHTFRTGHRIMVQIQSSWFPLLDRNPQTFCDIYHARPEDFQKATQRVYYSKSQESGLRMMIMPPDSK